MAESGTSPNGRRDFLQTVLAAPVLAAALVDTAQAEPAQRDVFVKHAYDEHTVNLGEVAMNYVVSGRATSPALLLIPGQTESWWGFEKAIAILEKDFQVFAVDLRGQGRTTWTPRRYTLDNMGNDLVRFIALVIKRPVITSGCSSGGVLSAWLSAFAMPGQVRGSHYEDPPLFASETNPLYGQSIRQAAVSASFEGFAKFLGDQWSIGDWKGLVASRAAASRSNSGGQNRGAQGGNPLLATAGGALEPPQMLKEYDPEWARLSRGNGRPELPARTHAGASQSAGAVHSPRPRDRFRDGPALGGAFGFTGCQREGDRHRSGPALRVRFTARRGARDASSRSCPLRAGTDDVGQDTSCVIHTGT